MRSVFTFFSLCLCAILCSVHAKGQVASFQIPDTVCLNQPVAITNTSTGGSKFYWNYCSSAIDSIPTGVNLGNVGGLLNDPRYLKLVYDDTNYYAFVNNHNQGIIRLSFGNSLQNTPTAHSLGNLGGLMVNIFAIDLIKDNGIWYGLVTVGGANQSTNPYIVRIDFGASLRNNTPVATSLGHSNVLSAPGDIKILKEGNNFIAFIVNQGKPGAPSYPYAAMDFTFARLNFGNSMANTPSFTNLGLLGGGASGQPNRFSVVKDNGNWHFFVNDGSSNNAIRRLDFGNSLLNTPTHANLGNISGVLSYPIDITFIRTCGKLHGYVISLLNNTLVKLNFQGDSLKGVMTARSLGNIGNQAAGHNFSNLIRVKDTLYCFIPNQTANTITRLAFASCTNSGIVSSNASTPPAVTFSSLGNHSVNLMMDEGLPTQNAYCRKVFVKAGAPAPAPFTDSSATVCPGQNNVVYTVPNAPGTTYAWSYSGTGAIINGTGNSVTVNFSQGATNGNLMVVPSDACGAGPGRSMAVTVSSAINFSLNTNGPVVICTGSDTLLVASGAGSNSYQWKDASGVVGTGNSYLAATTGNYYVVVANVQNCKDSSAEIPVHVVALPQVTITPSDTAFCEGGFVVLNAVSADTGLDYRWKNGNTLLPASASFLQVDGSGAYSIVATRRGMLGCTDSSPVVDVIVHPLPSPAVTWDGTVLRTDTGYSAYQWNIGNQGIPGATDAEYTPRVRENYSVSVTDSNGCAAVSTIYPVDQVGIDVMASHEIGIYPNPASDLVYITAPYPVRVKLYNIEGSQVSSFSGLSPIIDVAGLPEGVYILYIEDREGRAVRYQRLIKQSR